MRAPEIEMTQNLETNFAVWLWILRFIEEDVQTIKPSVRHPGYGPPKLTTTALVQGRDTISSYIDWIKDDLNKEINLFINFKRWG